MAEIPMNRSNQNLDPEEAAIEKAIGASDAPVPQANPERLEEVGTAQRNALNELKASHGGPREGAGRPRLNKSKTLLSLSPSARTALEKIAEKDHITLSEAADLALLSYEASEPG